jgi:hypothetical protein
MGCQTPNGQALRPAGLRMYAELCGWTLARAHARSGDRIAIAAYLGGSDVTFASARAGARLERMRTWLDSHQDQVIIVICLLLDFWLAGKSIYLPVS